MRFGEYEVDMTGQELLFMEQYTAAVQVNPDGPEEEYRANLQVGHQSFLLRVLGDLDYINWHRAMLAKALVRLVELEAPLQREHEFDAIAREVTTESGK